MPFATPTSSADNTDLSWMSAYYRTDAQLQCTSSPAAKRAKPSIGWPTMPLHSSVSLGRASSYDLGANDLLLSEFRMLVAPGSDDHVDDLFWQLVAPDEQGEADYSCSASSLDDKESRDPSTSGESDSELSLDEFGAASPPDTRPGSPAAAAGFSKADYSTRSTPTGSAHSRKEWLPWEDAAIQQGVAELGTKWRVLSARLPGRSDDAVR